jgi:CheY-like chemotaxis protein
LAKKSADSVISAAYSKLEKYLKSKLGLSETSKHDQSKPLPDWLDDVRASETTLRRAGISENAEVLGFGREVLARSSALRRARLVESVVKGACVLWVDDQPRNNRSECRLLQILGAEVKQVRSTPEAISELSRTRFDLLLSDIARDDMPDAGLRMLGQLDHRMPPVVFYVGQVDTSRGVPRGAFGIADLPEPLLHLVLDVFERTRV